MEEMRWIVIEIQTDDSFACYGPFASREDAQQYADCAYNPENLKRFTMIINYP